MDTLPEDLLGVLLRARGWKLAVAESCTGGLIGSLITDIPGSSEYFLGGVIAYANDVKTSLLNVSIDTLNQYGAVSRETVLEMARGARVTLNADIAVSVSGVAGPGGGSQEKPVGTTWIGMVTPHGEMAKEFRFTGNREQNKKSAAREALKMALDNLSA